VHFVQVHVKYHVRGALGAEGGECRGAVLCRSAVVLDADYGKLEYCQYTNGSLSSTTGSVGGSKR